MSAKILGRVWDLDLPHNKLLVLLALADHADHEGNNVFPSLGLVAWKTGYSQQQCRRVMSELEKDGILIATQRRQGFKTVYRIDVNKGKQKEAYTPSKMSPLTKSNLNPLHFEHSTPNMPSLKKEHEPSLEPSIEPNTRADAPVSFSQQPAKPETKVSPSKEGMGNGKVGRSEKSPRKKKLTALEQAKLDMQPFREVVHQMALMCKIGYDVMGDIDHSLSIPEMTDYTLHASEYVRLGGRAEDIKSIYEHIASDENRTANIAPVSIVKGLLGWKAAQKELENEKKLDQAYEEAKSRVETLMTDEQRKARAEQMKADRIAIFGEKTA